MTLSDLNDLAKYSMTRSVARSLGDSWASCVQTRPPKAPFHWKQQFWQHLCYVLWFPC